MKWHYFTLVLTFFLWGSSYIANRYAFVSFTPLAVLSLRYIIALPILGYLARRKGLARIERALIPYFIGICGLGYVLGTGLTLLSCSLLDASLSALLNATNPIVISMFAVLLLREQLTRNMIAGILCSLAGVAVILGVGESVSLIGVALSFAGVIFGALSSVLIRKASGRCSTEQMVFCCTLFAIPFSVPIALFELYDKFDTVTFTSVAAVIYITVSCSVVGNLLWNRSLASIGASVCSLFYPLQPLFSAVLGITLLREPITFNFVAGVVLISAGVVVGLLQPRRRMTRNMTTRR